MVRATPTIPPLPSKPPDRFIAAIPWSTRSSVVIHRSRHKGREYIRIRTWQHNREKGYSYPTKRRFVVPVMNAEPFIDGMIAALDGEDADKPDWLAAFEEDQERRQRAAADGCADPTSQLDTDEQQGP
jgi:hypothetical protein